MPMERERYPKDWEQIAFALKEEAGGDARSAASSAVAPASRSSRIATRSPWRT